MLFVCVGCVRVWSGRCVSMIIGMIIGVSMSMIVSKYMHVGIKSLIWSIGTSK